MKNSISTRKEALNYVFGNNPAIVVRLDKRYSETKQVLQFFSISELREIQEKKINRYGKHDVHYSPIMDIKVKIMKEKWAGNYMKLLIEGNKNIYWASPAYGHSDYNKSVWAKNSAENRRKMVLINSLITK